MIELSVVIPFYNEELNTKFVIQKIFDSLVKEGASFEILAVDNGSSDQTGLIIDGLSKIDARIKKVHVAVNQGYGHGILQGLKASSGNYLGYIDGDGQIDPEDIVGCFKQLQISQELQLAKGIRRKMGQTLWRSYVSKIYNLFMQSLFGIKATGINNKPKIFTKVLYERLKLESKDWFIDAEVMIKCTRLNVRYVEYPTKFIQRTKGESNVRLKTILEFLKNISRYFFIKMFKSF